MKSPLLLYVRSRLNIVLAISCAALAGAALLFGGWGKVAALGLAAAYLLATSLILFSRRGAREIVAESEEDRLKAVHEKIDAHRTIRDRVAVLRIRDEEVRKAVEYFLLVSGSYLEKCRELATYSPEANERIARVLEICQVFLGEMDESSTEKRYGQGSVDGALDLARKPAASILECATTIKEKTVEDLLGATGAEKLAIMEELEGRHT